MERIWLRSSQVTRGFLIGSFSLFLAAEVTIIVACLGSHDVLSPITIVYVLGSVLITAIPGIAGLRGYYGVKRLHLIPDGELRETMVVWLSRQFLTTAVFAYGATIWDIILLTKTLHQK